MSNVEQKTVFGVSIGDDGVPFIVLGIPKGAWEYMKDGKTNTFDLTKAGIPVKLMIYGAESHDAAKSVLDEWNASQGIASFDKRNKDYSL